jgi:hypothetical protein
VAVAVVVVPLVDFFCTGVLLVEVPPPPELVAVDPGAALPVDPPG